MGSTASMPTPVPSSHEETSLAALYPELQTLSSSIFHSTTLSFELSVVVAQFTLPDMLWLATVLEQTHTDSGSLRGSLRAKSFDEQEEAYEWARKEDYHVTFTDSGSLRGSPRAQPSGNQEEAYEWVRNACRVIFHTRRSDGLWTPSVATAFLICFGLECRYVMPWPNPTPEYKLVSHIATQHVIDASRYFRAAEHLRVRCSSQCYKCERGVYSREIVSCPECPRNSTESITAEIANGFTPKELHARAEANHQVKLASPPFLVLVYRLDALHIGFVRTSPSAN